MKPSSYGSIALKGRVVEGLNESSLFTHIPWVREQFVIKLGIDPYPGTLNLDITDTQDVENLKRIKERQGIEIVPAESGFCAAQCFHVLICGKIKGAIIIPQVADYPESKLEIIAPERVRDTLSLNIGDPVLVEVL
ncbi:DUF120 domain-containing protein [Chloroflexota bacterium]